MLTSSRADYSILLPLLKGLKEDPFFDLDIIAFGTHLSDKHGKTISLITEDGFCIKYSISSIPVSDSPSDISKAIADTILAFSDIWEIEKYDLIIAIGDRYEMFAACVSSVPFNLRIAHIHGGETTLGAFDDCFRNSITMMSRIHFTSAEKYMNRVIELKGDYRGVYNVGALSIDNLKSLDLLSISDFKLRFNIDLSNPSILITFQPETVAYSKNENYVSVLIDTLKELSQYQLIITMPNVDTMGNLIRTKLIDFIESKSNVFGVETFGTIGYLSCMKHCKMMIGNTSSGFIEASYFPKYVINIGDRQLGRIVTPNIKNVKIDKKSILEAVTFFETFSPEEYNNIYGDGNAALTIIEILKKEC